MVDMSLLVLSGSDEGQTPESGGSNMKEEPRKAGCHFLSPTGSHGVDISCWALQPVPGYHL